MLILNLNPIFEARGITKPIAFLKKAGFSANTAHNIVHKNTSNFKLEFIERLCGVLTCEPNDLLAYYPDKNNPWPQTHPLNNLIPEQNQQTIFQQAAQQLPYKDLKKLGLKMAEELKQKQTSTNDLQP